MADWCGVTNDRDVLRLAQIDSQPAITRQQIATGAAIEFQIAAYSACFGSPADRRDAVTGEVIRITLFEPAIILGP
jgi:hypothetical protein